MSNTLDVVTEFIDEHNCEIQSIHKVREEYSITTCEVCDKVLDFQWRNSDKRILPPLSPETIEVIRNLTRLMVKRLRIKNDNYSSEHVDLLNKVLQAQEEFNNAYGDKK